MKIKQWLYSRMFFRNMLADLFGRSAYSSNTGNFIPYFQYKIGPYQQDLFLYFPQKPHTRQYKNEIFNKLNEYEGYDIVKYLEFHYEQYPNKQDFLNFLFYEISVRTQTGIPKSKKQKLHPALNWAKERQQEQKELLRSTLEGEMQDIIRNKEEASPQEVERQVQVFVEKVMNRTDQIMDSAQEGMTAMARSFVTGNIAFSNSNHEEKFVQLLIVLKDLAAPAKGEQLFRKISDADITAILRLHFDAFKDLKPDTIRKNMSKVNSELNYKAPAIKELNAALQKHFY